MFDKFKLFLRQSLKSKLTEKIIPIEIWGHFINMPKTLNRFLGTVQNLGYLCSNINMFQ